MRLQQGTGDPQYHHAYCNLYKSIAAVKLVKENLSQSQQRDKDF